MMFDRLYQSLKPAMFRQDPETVHDRVIGALGAVSSDPSWLQRFIVRPDPRLAMQIFGLDVSHPLGIAAGLDKNGVAFPALLALGFGHVEIGTVTPRPQPGNAKPRVFRLVEDRAMINRMGFPGEGLSTVVSQAADRKRNDMIVGCNIGPNKSAVDAGTSVDDLVTGYRAMASMATWVTVNVSSPNTANLRALQSKSAMREMLAALNGERQSLIWRPLLIKISPDLSLDELDDLIDAAVEASVDGLIATNTTLSRPETLRSAHRDQSGGLSGPPVAPLAAAAVRRIAQRTNRSLPIIAAGGIETGADVVAAIEAGATLCQTYTGFIYRGPAMARQVEAEILAALDRRGLERLADLQS